MKNILNKSLILAMSIVALSSCSSDKGDITKISASTKPELLVPVSDTNFVLDKTKENDVATTLVWNYAAYEGSQTEVNYQVELVSNVGTAQEKIDVISNTTTKFVSFKVGELNTAVLNAGLQPNLATTVGLRIKSFIGDNSGLPMYSDIKNVTITAYPAWANWGIIGAATPGGWDADTDMDYDLATKTYSITLDMLADEYKFRLENAWDVNLGAPGPDAPLEMNGGNLRVAEAGNYTITLKVEITVDDAGKNVYSGTSTITKN